MTVLSSFNTQLSDLTFQLNEMYPDDNNIFTFRQTLLILLKTNAKKPMEYFSLYVYIYKDKIMNEDESFFKNGLNYNKLNNNYVPNLDNIIDILKLKWDTMSDNCKQNIWNYLKVLIIFKEQYDQKNNR
tara:strand:- start:120 stop:506 length:387 start_codon:yes stop_codon:yes gene_type:complete